MALHIHLPTCDAEHFAGSSSPSAPNFLMYRCHRCSASRWEHKDPRRRHNGLSGSPQRVYRRSSRAPPSHCDVLLTLVGSTALSARMDPEDLREVISAYQKVRVRDYATLRRVCGEVYGRRRAGCTSATLKPTRTMQSAPCAQGWNGSVATGALATHAPRQSRVGIATGLVVVGDLIGSGASQEQGIVGETPNLAARDHRPNGAGRWLRERRYFASKARQTRCCPHAKLHRAKR